MATKPTGPKSERGGGGSSRRHGKLTDLAQERVTRRLAGEKPTCNSPLAGESGKPDAKRCKNPAGAGTDHLGTGACRLHAGSMGPAKVVAAREEVVYQVETYRRFYGDKIQIGFEEALLEELQRSVGVVRWIEGKLSKWGLKDDDKWDSNATGMPNLVRILPGEYSFTVTDTEHAAWLREYRNERMHLFRVAHAGVQSGVAKEIVKVYQRQADLLYLIVKRTLGTYGIADDDTLHHRLPEIIREVTAKTA